MSQQQRSRRAQRLRQRRQQRRRRIAFAILGPLLLATIVAAVVLSRGQGNDSYLGATVELSMFDFGFEGNLTAPAGAVRVLAKNDGLLNHNIGIRRGPISGEVAAGRTAKLDLGVVGPGTYELYCDILGHTEKGMTATFTITEAVAPVQP